MVMSKSILQSRMKKLFTQAFTASEIAEPLLSFDSNRGVNGVMDVMNTNDLHVIGIRVDGVVAGYALKDELTEGACADHMHQFDAATLLTEDSSFAEVIDKLAESDYCFVSMLGQICAVITRNDIQKPPVRMWLFGMISIVEMYISRKIEADYPGMTWQKEIAESRLEIAETLQEQRKSLGQHIRLIDCLHLSDKAKILAKDPIVREDMGFESRRIAKKQISDIMSLRNSLAHAHDIITYDWDSIVLISRRLDRIMTRI